MLTQFSRTELLLGKEAMDKLANSRVAVFGIGGVGGYVGTIAGVGIMTIISSIMTVLNMPESGKKMVQGAIIIVLLLSVYGKKSKDN